MPSPSHEPLSCGTTTTFTIETVEGDLYAWSEGGDVSLETKESLRERLHDLNGGSYGSGLGGSALGSD
jgi:hypothetical protein